MNAVHSGRDEESVQPAFQANGQPQIAVVEKCVALEHNLVSDESRE